MRMVVLLSLVVGAGCYRYVPLEAPTPSVPLSATLTDRGSVELSEAVGATAVRIDGRLISVSETAVSLAVAKVSFRNGLANAWQGEPVTVPRAYIATLKERRLSRGRTVAFSTLLVGGVVALIMGIDLVVFGDDDAKGPPGGPPDPG